MKKKLLLGLLFTLLLGIGVVACCDLMISRASKSKLYEGVDSTRIILDYDGTRTLNSIAKMHDVISVSHIKTDYGDLLCLEPDMTGLKMDMVCGEIPSPENSSIILAFAGAFTGTEFDKGHANVAGDHVAGGKRYKGYRCKRNTGAFTWSAASGPKFHYKDYSEALDKAAQEEGMGFAQEMMIHDGKAVKTTRPLKNRNVFRALCLNSANQLALYESQGVVTFGNFIDALLSAGVKEALYTDMGEGWNYCFYRVNQSDKSPRYLHSMPMPYASNFIAIKVK